MKTPVLSATMQLVDVMSPEERAALANHLAGYGAVPLPRGGALVRFVSGLFTPGTRMSATAVIEAAQRAHPEASRRQVYNTLGYLLRRRAIRGIQYGVYEAVRTAGAA